MIQLCQGDGPYSVDVNVYLQPIPATPPTDRSVLRFREIVDSRISQDPSALANHTVEVPADNPTRLRLQLRSGQTNGHFKAVYLMWWEEGSEPRPPAVKPPATPAAPDEPRELGPCAKKPYLPQCHNPRLDRR